MCSVLSAFAQNEAQIAKSDSLFDVGIELCDNQQYIEAIAKVTEALNIREQIYGKEHVDCAIMLDGLVIINYSLGNYSEVIRLGKESLMIKEKNFGKDNSDYSTLLSILVVSNYFSGNYAEAKKLAIEELNIIERLYGKENTDYAMSLSNLALYNSKLGNYAESVRLATEAMNIRERLLGKEHPDYATSLNNLALYNSELGNYEDAIHFGAEALKLYEFVLGKEHSDYTASMNNLADYNSKIGNFTEAIRIMTDALNIMERISGKKNSAYALSLGNLATYYSALGNNTEAIRLCTEALNIYAGLYGKEHPDYARCLSNLAVCNSELGNYVEAIRLCNEAMNIRERVLGKNHPEYAISLNNLAMASLELGDYVEAMRFCTDALNICENVYGKEHPNYAMTLKNLAVCNSELGKYAEAIRLGAEALYIQERVFGKEHPDYASTLSNLAMNNSELGNYVEAIKLETEAMNIREHIFGRKHLDYGLSLNNLAGFYKQLGNYNDAIGNSKESLTIFEGVFGKMHPYTILALQNLSSYCNSNGEDFENVEKYSTEANNLNSELIRKTFAGLTARERQMFWDKNKYWFENQVNLYANKTNSPILIENAYNATLMAKGILLNSERDFSALIAESGDEEAIETFNKLRTTRNILNRLYEKPIAERLIDTDSLENVALVLERELIDRSKVYGDFTRNMAIDWKEVQRKLGSKDVAVEFVSFKTDEGNQVYAAYVINNKMKTPEMVRICDAGELNKISPSGYYQSGDLSRLVWGKLAEYIANAENVYFAPAGELYNIAIESLPDPSGDELISDHHKMYRLSSTRELAVIKDKDMIEHAALYGGLKYDTDVDVLEHDTVRYATVNNRDLTIINRVDSLNLRGGVSDLPNTKIEVENISRSFKRTSIEPILYTGTGGTEASFKALSGKKINIMHIATHGFYWTESEVRRSRNLGFLQIGDNSPRYVEDKALTRSGLLFTGANNVLTGKPVPDNVPDGVLTAKEISVLDLRGLDMVVLSACQTGLGEITGDGVFGLQRGFKKAGANTLLMSLWKVDDRATQMLMTKFYEHFLSGKTKLESLTLAQKYLREYEEDTDGEKIKPFEAPKYWAAFILLDAIN